MKKGRILLIDTFHPCFKAVLEQNGFTVTEGYMLSRYEIAKRINDWDGIAIRSRFKIDAAFLEPVTRMKFIARGGAGMENIDLAAAASKGIACLSAAEGNRDAVGEHAIGMLLMLMNNLLRADQEVREGFWNREKNRGFELQGKTVGIIGFGNMGSSFANKLRGFGVNILAYDKYITINPDQYPFVKQCSQDDLMDSADIISLHLPLTPETHYFASEDFFNRLKKPVWFINTARGLNTDTAALVNAIRIGKVRGAALDVLEYESISFESIAEIPPPLKFLFDSDKVVLSPHIAGWTFESHEKIANTLVEKILAL